ncbi:MAG: tRNA (guanine-N7-)-methyltransferase [Halieaceae bacterium]
MQVDSLKVSSNQNHTHPDLPAVLQRHTAKSWKPPIATFNQHAFNTIEAKLAESRQPLILDSFCGTGHSTARLAVMHPNHLVIGIDKSAHRLARHPGQQTSNYLLLQAECEPLWMLLTEHGLRLDFHYLLYPNPWPKKAHLKRRIHGHPAFPLLLALGGRVELRSNWQTYVEEFGLAMLLSGVSGCTRRLLPQEPLTLFEQKYHSSGHDLWQYTGTC